jgi:uncharacterized membrane protein
MQLLLFVALVVGPYLAARLLGRNGDAAGRLGIALVFFLGALGHFVMAEPMSHMIPPQVPYRYEITLASGVLEAALGVAAAMNLWPGRLGWVLVAFFVLVFPLNVYAAIERVPFGGHEAGPQYLLIRTPLQMLFIGWTYRFFLRREPQNTPRGVI